MSRHDEHAVPAFRDALTCLGAAQSHGVDPVLPGRTAAQGEKPTAKTGCPGGRIDTLFPPPCRPASVLLFMAGGDFRTAIPAAAAVRAPCASRFPLPATGIFHKHKWSRFGFQDSASRQLSRIPASLPRPWAEPPTLAALCIRHSRYGKDARIPPRSCRCSSISQVAHLAAILLKRLLRPDRDETILVHRRESPFNPRPAALHRAARSRVALHHVGRFHQHLPGRGSRARGPVAIALPPCKGGATCRACPDLPNPRPRIRSFAYRGAHSVHPGFQWRLPNAFGECVGHTLGAFPHHPHQRRLGIARVAAARVDCRRSASRAEM